MSAINQQIDIVDFSLGGGVTNNLVIKMTQTTQFSKVDESIRQHSEKLPITIKKSLIPLEMESLTKMKGKLSLEKSASSTNKSMVSSKKSAIYASTTIEKMAISARTKALALKRPKSFLMTLKIKSLSL